MIKELYFAWYAIKKNIQSSSELRTSFLMNVAGMAINNTAFIFLWAYFVKSVGVIGGWTVADIVGLQGFMALSYGIVFSVASGLRKLPEYVASGAFDRFMLSPKNLLIRTATASFSVSALGDMVFGIVSLVIYGFLIQMNFFQILLTLLLIIISSVVFIAALTAITSASFIFIDAVAVTSGMLELFITPAIFHGGAFQGLMRFIFTFIIPSLLVGSLPVEVVRDMSWDKFLLIFVLSVVWSLLSVKIFYAAVKKYESSKFMNFVI